VEEIAGGGRQATRPRPRPQQARHRIREARNVDALMRIVVHVVRERPSMTTARRNGDISMAVEAPW
jgi:hypothetical protein